MDKKRLTGLNGRRFQAKEDLYQIIGSSDVYPVVRKRGGYYILIDVCGSLEEAKASIQGNSCFIWRLEDKNLINN
jgi:hypothetical protein